MSGLGLGQLAAHGFAKLTGAQRAVGAATGMYTPTAGEMADMQAFGQFVEGVRQWGRAERDRLGL